jgi:hypothetical protein
MAGFFGSDFDPSNPADTDAVAQGAGRIRDVKQRIKTFFGGLFNLETAAWLTAVIPSDALQAIGGLTAGTYTNVTLTVNTKGQITSISTGSAGSYKTAGAVETYATGGTGLSSLPGNGMIPIGNGAGYTLAAIVAAAGGGIVVTLGAGTITLSINPAYFPSLPFFAEATLPSATGATPVQLVAPIVSGPLLGRKLYLNKFIMRVDGATAWTTTSIVTLTDTNGTPNPFVTVPVAALTANARVLESTAGVILEDSFSRGTGSATNAGLQIFADVNAGAGSNLIVQASGFYK